MMINLQRYVMLFEGGAGGHMAHPIDYTDFTGEELIQLVTDLFSGKVETMKEKLDGMNIKFKTYVSFGEMIQYTNPNIISLQQHGTYKGNTLHMATDLFKQMSAL